MLTHGPSLMYPTDMYNLLLLPGHTTRCEPMWPFPHVAVLPPKCSSFVNMHIVLVHIVNWQRF